MLKKRGMMVLVVILEVLASLFASYLLLEVTLGWATGETVQKLYYSQDLALLADTLFISPDVTVFDYKDNLSEFDIVFEDTAVQLSTERLDPDKVLYFFTPFDNSTISSTLLKPPKLVLTRFGSNLTADIQEYKIDLKSQIVKKEDFEDIKITDGKSITLSQNDIELKSLVEEKIYPALKQNLRDFSVNYIGAPSQTDDILIVFEKAENPYDFNINHPIPSDNLIYKKVRKLGFLLLYKIDSEEFSPSLAPNNQLFKSFENEQVALVIALGEKTLKKESEITVWIYSSLNDYFK